MRANINTNVFRIEHCGTSKAVDLTMDFDELADVLRRVMNKWFEVADRQSAPIIADSLSCGALGGMGEMLVTIAKNACSEYNAFIARKEA